MVSLCPHLAAPVAREFRQSPDATRAARSSHRHRCVLTWVPLLLVLSVFEADILFAADSKPDLLDRWFASQAQVRTWSAGFIQTRTLKALKDPLMSEGRVWFTAPNRFHWELGDPAQTIAVRESQALVILYPKLKRAERYPLDEQAAGQWRDALTLLEAGFPRSRAEMEKQFRFESLEEKGGLAELVLRPRSARARKLISEIRLVFDRTDLLLRATELRFADGSALRNDFNNSRINPPVDESIFSVSIPTDFKTTEPLGKAP